MDRLTEKLALAAQVVATQTTLLENDADTLIARGAEFSKRRSATFAAQHAVLDQGTKGMDALDAKLALLDNAPLQSSGGSLEGQPGQVDDPPATEPVPPQAPPVMVQAVEFHPMHQTMARAVPSRRDL